MTFSFSKLTDQMTTDDNDISFIFDKEPTLVTEKDDLTVLDVVTYQGKDIVYLNSLLRPFDFGLLFENEEFKDALESKSKLIFDALSSW